MNKWKRTIDAADNLADAASQVVAATVEFINALCSDIADAISPFADSISLINEIKNAYEWAEKEHHQWIRIYRRTKKKRTRKKIP